MSKRCHLLVVAIVLFVFLVDTHPLTVRLTAISSVNVGLLLLFELVSKIVEM